MVFNTGSTLLDAIVLAIVSQEPQGTYGYKITQEVRMVLEVSESTLYPVLRRLLKDGRLEAYDMEYAGRNRRYYKITPAGWVQLEICREEWKRYSGKVTSILGPPPQETEVVGRNFRREDSRSPQRAGQGERG